MKIIVLRNEKKLKMEDMAGKCFICGLEKMIVIIKMFIINF